MHVQRILNHETMERETAITLSDIEAIMLRQTLTNYRELLHRTVSPEAAYLRKAAVLGNMHARELETLITGVI